MKEFVEKLIEKFEREAFAVQLKQGIKNPSTHDMFLETFTVRQIEEIVNQLAEEYKTQLNDNDLMIVESLPSLYPMKEFEEEALKRVIGCSKKEYNNGWIPCEKKLPETNESVLCWAKSTARGGDVCFVGSYHKGFWFLQSSANTHSFPGQYKIVAWQKLPEPFKPSAE